MKFAILVAGVVLVVPAWAARPFVTDDARLTTAGSCQLESWVRLYEASSEFWALPACNPGSNLEITLGGGRASYTGAHTTDDYVLQVKTLFKPLVARGWGWGLAVGRVEHPEIAPGPNQLGTTYAYLPFSASLAEDRFFLHANVGWLRDKASQQDRNTWGLGGEYYPQPRLAVIAESFGDDKGRPYWQAGLRYSIIPDLFQVDATTGQQQGGDSASRWLSFGLRWTPDRLF
jgi:hypothetical protein